MKSAPALSATAARCCWRAWRTTWRASATRSRWCTDPSVMAQTNQRPVATGQAQGSTSQPRARPPHQSAVIFRSLMVAAPLGRFLLHERRQLGPRGGLGLRPCLFSASFTPGSFSTLTISWFQRSAAAQGSCRGPQAYQFSASKPESQTLPPWGCPAVRRAREPSGGQGDQFARFHMRHGRGARQVRGHALAQQVLQRRRAALVGDVGHVDAARWLSSSPAG